MVGRDVRQCQLTQNWYCHHVDLRYLRYILRVRKALSQIKNATSKTHSKMSLINQASTAFFVLFVAAWVKFRLFNYPLYVVSAIFNADVISEHVIPYHFGFKLFITTIFVLQIYWSYFIYRKLITVMKQGIAAGKCNKKTNLIFF
jgi:hypothetical protein